MTNITEDIKYIGVNDREIDLFEGQYVVPNGMAYNSYVILDEKVAVMDTVDRHFTTEWLKNLESALAGRQPDYLIVQHMEPDHSASIAAVRQAYPAVRIVGNAKTLQMIEGYYGIACGTVEVKEGDVLDLGGLTLAFCMIPMVHWPETMATWCAEERTIFSGDAFGTFGALNGGVTDEQLDVEPFWEEMRRYYACIVGKYGQPVQRALAKVAPLDIAMICSTHGPVWRREIARVVELYDKVSRYEGEPGAVIAYGSMYGNTEQMAETVARGLAAAGVRPIVVYNLSTADVSQVLRDIFRYDTLVVGSPTYNGQLYPPVDALLRKIAERCIPHRRFACFGSFTWAGAAVRRMTEFAEGMKWPVVGAPVELKQGYSTAVEPACRVLVDALVEDMKR
mgnify:CR=1 FL=1